MKRGIETRTAEQCRSHHQKMLKYHGDIPGIIAHIACLQKQQNELGVVTNKRKRPARPSPEKEA
jgi:hypothetical protein